MGLREVRGRVGVGLGLTWGWGWVGSGYGAMVSSMSIHAVDYGLRFFKGGRVMRPGARGCGGLG